MRASRRSAARALRTSWPRRGRGEATGRTGRARAPRRGDRRTRPPARRSPSGRRSPGAARRARALACRARRNPARRAGVRRRGRRRWRSRSSTSSPGNERAVAAALAWRASAVVADDPAAGLALLRAGARGRARQPRSARRERRRPTASPSCPSSPSTRCSRRSVPSVTDEGFGYDPQRGELWFAGEAAEAVLLELETRRRELEGEVAALQGQAATQQAESEALPRSRSSAAAAADGSPYADGSQHLRTPSGAARQLAAELAARRRARARGATRVRRARTSVPPRRSWSEHGSAAKGRSGCCRSTQPSATRSSGRHAS